VWEKDVEKFVTVQTESGLYFKTHTLIFWVCSCPWLYQRWSRPVHTRTDVLCKKM